jgi:hypothetical protein
MRHPIRTVGLGLLAGSMLATPLALTLGGSAGADSTGLSTAPASASAVAAVLNSGTTGKTTSITKAEIFKPSHLSGPGGTTGTPTSYSAFVVNKSGAAQQMTLSGSDFGNPIPPKSGVYIYDEGTAKITVTIGLVSNSRASLVLKIT